MIRIGKILIMHIAEWQEKEIQALSVIEDRENQAMRAMQSNADLEALVADQSALLKSQSKLISELKNRIEALEMEPEPTEIHKRGRPKKLKNIEEKN